MLTVVVNLYCILALLLVKKMRKMDLYLVFLQSVFDFLTSGMFNTIFNCVMALNYVEEFCDEWKSFRDVYDKDIPNELHFRIEPKLIEFALAKDFYKRCKKLIHFKNQATWYKQKVTFN